MGAGPAIIARAVGAIALAAVSSAAEPARAAEPALRAWTRGDYVTYFSSGRRLAPIEGIWILPDNSGEIAITQYAPGAGGEFEFFGVVLASASPRWRPGDGVLFLKTTATPSVLVGSWAERTGYAERLSGYGATALVKNANLFEIVGPRDVLFVRMYPKSPRLDEPERTGSGTGFFVAPGMVATNHHVVEGARSVTVRMGGVDVAADVALKDAGNDLALLRLRPGAALDAATASRGTRCAPLGDALAVKPGDRIYTLGFPLGDLLGSSLKVSEGIVSSTTGLRNDATVFQVSVPIQPGSSGSPVFDASGRVIGVVTASLDARTLLAETGSVPQNVNFAVKAVYLKTLLSFAPDATCPRPPAAQPLTAAELQEALGRAVVQVRVEE